MDNDSNMVQCDGPGCTETFVRTVWNQRYHNQDCKNNARNMSRRLYTQDVADAVASIYLDEEDANDEDLMRYLRSENLRLERALKKAKSSINITEQNILDTITEGLQSFKLSEVKKPTISHNKPKDLVAVAVISDQQLSKITPSYNTDICADRMRQYAYHIIDRVEGMRSQFNIPHLRLWFLGDIIEGVGIFAGQQFLTSGGLYRQITIDGPEILGTFLKTLLEYFETIKVVGVIGNHGRMPDKDMFDPETNGDRMLYRILELVFRDNERVEFEIPDGQGEKNWFAVDNIGEYSSLLLHGDQFKSFNPLLMQKKILAWKAGGIKQDFKDVTMGHFHQSTKFTVGNITVRINGTTESNNTWAQEEIGHMGDPSQLLMFIDPKHGVVHSEHDIFLD